MLVLLFMYLSPFVLVVSDSSAVRAFRSPTIRIFPWVWKWVMSPSKSEKV